MFNRLKENKRYLAILSITGYIILGFIIASLLTIILSPFIVEVINDEGNIVQTGIVINVIVTLLMFYIPIIVIYKIYCNDRIFNWFYSGKHAIKKYNAYYYRVVIRFFIDRSYREILNAYGIIGYKDLRFLKKFQTWYNNNEFTNDEYDQYNAMVYYEATKIRPNENKKTEEQFNRINDILIKLNIVSRDTLAPYSIINSFGIMFAMIFKLDKVVLFELEPEPDLFEKYNNITDGFEFEYFVADILSKNGFTDIKVTQGSGDQGIDVLAKKDNLRYAIQCKLYSSKVGNSAVQQVTAGKGHYNAHVGVVITNNLFTPSAVELAQSNNILLWDNSKLEELIHNAI